MDPTGPVREAGAIAYNMLVAQERGVEAPAPETAPPATAAVAPIVVETPAPTA